MATGSTLQDQYGGFEQQYKQWMDNFTDSSSKEDASIDFINAIFGYSPEFERYQQDDNKDNLSKNGGDGGATPAGFDGGGFDGGTDDNDAQQGAQSGDNDGTDGQQNGLKPAPYSDPYVDTVRDGQIIPNNLPGFMDWQPGDELPNQFSTIDGVDTFVGNDPTYNNLWLQELAGINKENQQNYYDTTKNDITSYFTDQLNDQKDKTDRNIKFTMARRGLSGGSADFDTQMDSGIAYDKGLGNIALTGKTAVDNLTASDENSRINLIGQIRNGMDQGNAVSNALSQLDSNRNDAYNSAVGSDFGDAFADLSNVLSYNNYLNGQSQGSNLYNTRKNNFNFNYSPYSGRS